jgi:hypothetical protein
LMVRRPRGSPHEPLDFVVRWSRRSQMSGRGRPSCKHTDQQRQSLRSSDWVIDIRSASKH